MMIAIWLTFAPTQAGGMASYIIVIGNSMEPNFHVGDLVIAHEEPNYQIGDAVVYRNLELENFVFHRIISQEMGRYTLKGDNNSWTDTYQPSHEEVLGKLWLRIPRGGTYIQKIRTPFVMTLIAGALGGILATSLFTGKSKGNKHMNKKSIQEWFVSIKQKTRSWLAKSNNTESQKSSNPNKGNLLEGSFFVLGLVALASLIIGIISFSRPASRTVIDDVSYEHIGFFSYSASAPQGVYDANAIKSGDPIFTKLTCSVDVSLQYTLIAQQAENIAGTYQLTAIISEPVSGWQRIVPLQTETIFSENAFGSTAKLNFCQMESLTQSMEQGTDFHPSSYILTIAPNIKMEGELSGRALQSSFNPNLIFRYDRVHFYLAQEEEQNNPLNPTETGVISEARTEANTMLLFGAEMAIPALRLFAALGLVGSLAGITLLGLRLQSVSKSNQSRFNRIRYDSMMIDIQNEASINSSNMVDVSSIEDLAKLAERFNAVILHAESDHSHTYYVKGEGNTYRYAMTVIETGSTVPEKEATSQEGEA